MRIPKHYRLVNEHPHSFEMHDTRDGSKFHIAKDHIDEKMHAKVASVPKYADGGKVANVFEDIGNFITKPVPADWQSAEARQNQAIEQGRPSIRRSYFGNAAANAEAPEMDIVNQYKYYPLPPVPWEQRPEARELELNQPPKYGPQPEVPAGFKGPLQAADGAEITEEDAKKYGNMTTQERLEALARYTNPNITEESNKEEKYPAAEETPKTEAVKKEVPIPKVEGGEWAPMMPWHTPISDQGPAARNPAGELPPAMMERVFPTPTTGQIGAPLTEDTTMTPGTGAVPVYPPAVTTTEDRGAAYVPPGSENNIAPTGRTTLAPGMSLNAPQEAPLGVSPSGKPILGPPTEAQAGALTHTPTTTEIMQQRNAAMMQPYGEMENLIRGGINAESDYAKKANDSWQGYVADMAKRPDIASYVEQLEKKNQALATSMVQNQTNPNRLWQNMGTGSKIASAIGLMFGGIGAGMTGGTNYAMETINKAIDRDIEAQKNSRETVMNLWNMNKDLTGTKLAAELQTRQQALSAVEAQIKGYSALAGGPMAAAKAAPVLMEIQKARQDLALMQSLTSGANPGAEDSHQKMMSYMQLKNPDVYKDMISKYMPNQGTTKIPLTDNDRDAFGGYNTLEKVLNEARNFSIQEGPKMPFQEANERAKVIRNALILEANKLFKINRLNEQELGLFEGMAPNPASWFNANTVAKLNEMLHQVDAHRKVDYMKVGFIPFPEADIKQKARTWLMQNRYSTDPAIQQRVKEMQQYLGG